MPGTRSGRSAITNYLQGRSFDRKAFTAVAGDEAARSALLDAMAWME